MKTNNYENNNETVTLNLSTYEDLIEELEDLREKVKQKTIIKKEVPVILILLPIYIAILMLMLSGFLCV